MLSGRGDKMGLRSRIKNRIKRTLGRNEQTTPAKDAAPKSAPVTPKSPRAQYASPAQSTQPEPLSAPVVSTEAKATSTETETAVSSVETLSQEIAAQRPETDVVTTEATTEAHPSETSKAHKGSTDTASPELEAKEADTESEDSDSAEEIAVETTESTPAQEQEKSPVLDAESESESESTPESATINDAAQENGIDTTGAFAVYGLTRLIPETCPNCGAKTYGNWTRTDDGFACTLCDELY